MNASTMRIAILCNQDVYALRAVNALMPQLADHTVALFCSSRVGGPSASEPIEMTRLHEVENALMRQLVLGDVPIGPGRPARLHSFETLAETHGSPLLGLDDINQPAGLTRLAQFAPDLAVSIRFGKILRPAAIAVPSLGVINLHSGLLPAYRGVMPTFWSMINGEDEIGTTLHWIVDASIDTGPTIASARQPLNCGASYLEQVMSLYDAGVANILDAIQQLAAMTASSDLAAVKSADMSASESKGAYYSFPDQAAVATFNAAGLMWYPDNLAGLN